MNYRVLEFWKNHCFFGKYLGNFEARKGFRYELELHFDTMLNQFLEKNLDFDPQYLMEDHCIKPQVFLTHFIWICILILG
jgi:hypothetical protein